jgi:hypothetical protein
MSDEPFYSPTHKPNQPREPKPGERLWTMTNGQSTCWAELRAHAGFGFCELQIFVNGELRVGHMHESLDLALAEAAMKAEMLRLRNWQPRQRDERQ